MFQSLRSKVMAATGALILTAAPALAGGFVVTLPIDPEDVADGVSTVGGTVLLAFAALSIAFGIAYAFVRRMRSAATR